MNRRTTIGRYRFKPKEAVLARLPSAILHHDPTQDYPWRVRYDFGWVGGGGAATPRGAWQAAWRDICGPNGLRRYGRPMA
jgi:hypothetical protein